MPPNGPHCRRGHRVRVVLPSQRTGTRLPGNKPVRPFRPYYGRRQQCRSQDKQPQIASRRIIGRKELSPRMPAHRSGHEFEDNGQREPEYPHHPAVTGCAGFPHSRKQKPGNQENAPAQHDSAYGQRPPRPKNPVPDVFPQSPIEHRHRNKTKPNHEGTQDKRNSLLHRISPIARLK